MLSPINELLGILLTGYIILPTMLGRFFHIGVHWRGQRDSEKIALTFDDGPDPVYTPEILSILNKYHVRATFFVVGAQAEKYPALIHRIKAEGHTLGIHGYQHRLVWLLGPLASIREVKRGTQVIHQIIGSSPLFFRPAWGVFNLCSLIYLWLGEQKAVLWSFMSGDWLIKATPASILDKVTHRVKPGAVIVFHDRCVKPGASEEGPAKTIRALPGILEHIAARGLQPVSLEDFL